VPRKEWDPERLIEQPYDVQKTLQMFEESNRLYAARSWSERQAWAMRNVAPRLTARTTSQSSRPRARIRSLAAAHRGVMRHRASDGICR